MRTFRLSPPIQAWFDQMMHIVAMQYADPAPPAPPAPTNPEELAFFNTVLLPLAAEMGQTFAEKMKVPHTDPIGSAGYIPPEQQAPVYQWQDYGGA